MLLMFKYRGNKEASLLLLSIINIIVLSIGHTYDISLVLYISFIGFILLSLFGPKELFLPIMLFYLPWSPVMKTAPDSYTIYTIITPLFFLSMILESKKNRITKETFSITRSTILLTASIVLLTLGVKLISGYSIELDYLMFLMMLLMIPTYIKHCRDKITFRTCIIFMTFGTISACIAAEILMSYPHMMRYINVYVWEQVGLLRTSGFYGDANFYSTHILVSICGLLILSASLRGKSCVFSFTAVVILVFFGAKSVSKMFLLTLGVIIVLWLISILCLRGKSLKKLGVITGLALAVVFILSSNLFADEINYYLFRFSTVDNATSFTTGRTDLWMNYISYLCGNPFVLLFGEGYTNILPDFGAGSHSTIIQILYQFGLAGTILIIFWFIGFKNAVISREKTRKTAAQHYWVITFAIACFAPWLALDMLFFDEFFYITSLFFIGLNDIRGKYDGNKY